MNRPRLSNRAHAIPASPIRKLAGLAAAARAHGRFVYHLNIGQPDIKTPKEFFQGLEMFKDEIVAYEGSAGKERLRKAWSHYMNSTLGLPTAPEQFLITSGASEALVFTFLCMCDPEDEILVFDPTYANYLGFAAMGNVKIKPVPTRIEDNFRLPDDSIITSRIGERTRAILLCHPNNPTGTVYTAAEMERLIRICNERNLFLIVDETYREFIYDDSKPLSVFHLEPDNPRIVVIDSLSKRFSLCGARIGCLVTANEELLAKALHIAQARLSVATIEQFAAAFMLEHVPPSYVHDVLADYRSRRDVLFRAISSIPSVVAHRPEGAFYTVVRLPVRNAEQFATFLLSQFQHESSTVFVAPAQGFYAEPNRGTDEVRIAYVLEKPRLEIAVRIIDLALREFAGPH